MKQIGLYILLICLLLACLKEDGITPGIGFENLYTIQDDPNDSIQHKRYELYTTYGVPVFFNDIHRKSVCESRCQWRFGFPV